MDRLRSLGARLSRALGRRDAREDTESPDRAAPPSGSPYRAAAVRALPEPRLVHETSQRISTVVADDTGLDVVEGAHILEVGEHFVWSDGCSHALLAARRDGVVTRIPCRSYPLAIAAERGRIVALLGRLPRVEREIVRVLPEAGTVVSLARFDVDGVDPTPGLLAVGGGACISGRASGSGRSRSVRSKRLAQKAHPLYICTHGCGFPVESRS